MKRRLAHLPLLALLAASSCRDLAVTSIEPAEVPAGRASDVLALGRGFDDGMTLMLRAAGLEVSLAPVDVEGAERARARVPAAAPAGEYTLVAALDGAVAELEGALRVVEGEVRATFIDVGQGDATLVLAPSGETLLVDGGAMGEGAAVRAVLERESGGRLDAVVLSHVDADHLGGLVEVLAGDDDVAGTADDLVPEIALGPLDDGSCTTGVCTRMRSLAAWPFEVALPGRSFALGEADVEVVAADGDVGGGVIAGTEDDNEKSVVLRVSFGGRTLLVTGDLTGGGDGTADVETPLSERTGPVDVLRASHHGSRTSSAAAALGRWVPRAAVFSFGTDNAYCHPHQEVLERVAASSGKVYATGAGTVDDMARCGAATDAPTNARLGVGDVVLRMGADGALLVGDEPL